MKNKEILDNNISFQKFILISTSFIFLFVMILSIGYASFNETLEIEGDAIVRSPASVRFTDNSISSLDNGGIEKASSKYTVDTISNHIELPNCNSTTSYNVTVRNNSNSDIVIKSLDKDVWNNDNIEYEVIGYNFGSDIIPSNSEITFKLKFKYLSCDTDNHILDSILKLVLNDEISINYYNNILSHSNSNNPVKAFKGDNVTASFSNVDDNQIGVKIGNKTLTNGMSYTYPDGEKSTFTINNGVAEVTNVNSDISFLYIDYIYINLGDKTSYYKASPYNTSILNIKFVDYIDIDGADASWDITDDKNGLAYAWVSGTDLYIGSEFTLVSTDLSNAFFGLSVAQTLDFNDKLDTSQTIYMNGMFQNCRKLISLDVSFFDTSNVKNMSSMFNSVQTITSLDLSNFDTSNVTDMSSMFMSCSKVTNFNVSSFDTRNVTNMTGMFYGESALEHLELSNFDTSNVTAMTNMFYGDAKIKTLDLSNFTAEKVTSAAGMFNSCKLLTSINLSNFNTSNKFTNMSNMFRECQNLTTLDLSSFNTISLKLIDTAFYNDKLLTTIYVSDKWSNSAITSGKNTFEGCTNLKGNISYDPNKLTGEYASTDYYMTLK